MDRENLLRSIAKNKAMLRDDVTVAFLGKRYMENLKSKIKKMEKRLEQMEIYEKKELLK